MIIIKILQLSLFGMLLTCAACSLSSPGESTKSTQPAQPNKDEGPDLTAPIVESITIIPSNPIEKRGTVTVQFDVHDAGSGINAGYLFFESPGHLEGIESRPSISSWVTFNPAASKWEAAIPIEEYNENGVWKITDIAFKDNAGNIKIYRYKKGIDGTYLFDESENQLSTFKIPSFSVKGNNGDITPPELTGITQNSVEVTKPGKAAFSLTLTDAYSGCNGGQITVSSPGSLSGQGSRKELTGKLQFNAETGKWDAEVFFEDSYQNGTWLLSEIKIYDKAGNKSCYTLDDYSKIKTVFYNKYAQTVTTIEAPTINVKGIAGDITAPVINTMSVDNKSVTGKGLVTFTFEITEVGSGFEKGSIGLCTAGFFDGTGVQDNLHGKIGYNDKSGKWEGVINFQDKDDVGEWMVFSISVEDKAGNKSSYIYEEQTSKTHLCDGTGTNKTHLEIVTITKK